MPLLPASDVVALVVTTVLAVVVGTALFRSSHRRGTPWRACRGRWVRTVVTGASTLTVLLIAVPAAQAGDRPAEESVAAADPAVVPDDEPWASTGEPVLPPVDPGAPAARTAFPGTEVPPTTEPALPAIEDATAPGDASTSGSAAVPTTTVWGMGDSLFLQCGDSLGVGTRSLGMVGWWGGTTQDMRNRMSSPAGSWPYLTESSHAEELADFRRADSWVIGLGSNDMRLLTVAQYRANVDWFMQQSAGRPVAWFNLHNGNLVDATAQFNAVLRDAAGRWPNLTVLDWDAFVTAHPSLLHADRLHLADNAHGCEQGRFSLIRAALGAGPTVGQPVELSTEDPIAVGYDTSSGAAGSLGGITGPTTCGLRDGGCLRSFANGQVLWSPRTGAHAVTGAVWGRWASTFGETGPLGYPIAEATCALRNGGCSQEFTTGSVVWSEASGARTILGPIRAAWLAAGGQDGALGYPTTSDTCSLSGNGCFQFFEGGSVYWSVASGAHITRGAIYDRWAVQGWERGVLGYPTSDESCGLRRAGCYQTFQGGLVHWSPASGAHVTRGAIYDRWAVQGWERGVLGYPTSDESCGLRGAGCYQTFQGGLVHWSPASGAHVTRGAIYDRWAAQGWESGLLGYPTSDEGCGLRGAGCYQTFQGGVVHWSPASGAHVTWGAIYATWAAQGWEAGRLGYPVTDEYRVTGGIAQRFQGGTLTYANGRVR
ncbi:Conserved protein of unknown function with LGFP domains [Modestobacter italicus]|uniref:LGFP repeat protein n=1 Tax=Modestobacter italicus (strain DSM 44449 / CECT 9708 / BC 501) TaxID=2732864 RepID=I4ERJ2_MODI5|nr:hypothetical protein [Modestobacter marinus]CCH86005.1 Conserved protein of unknown function with LGFP domains [Modestobacter marinus]